MSLLSRNLNDIICLDHFYIRKICILHCMDMAVAIEHNAAKFMSSTSLEQTLVSFESSWLSQFWLSDAIHVDSALAGENLKNDLGSRCVQLRIIVPPMLHGRNSLKSKHGINSELISDVSCC